MVKRKSRNDTERVLSSTTFAPSLNHIRRLWTSQGAKMFDWFRQSLTNREPSDLKRSHGYQSVFLDQNIIIICGMILLGHRVALTLGESNKDLSRSCGISFEYLDQARQYDTKFIAESISVQGIQTPANSRSKSFGDFWRPRHSPDLQIIGILEICISKGFRMMLRKLGLGAELHPSLVCLFRKKNKIT